MMNGAVGWGGIGLALLATMWASYRFGSGENDEKKAHRREAADFERSRKFPT